MRQVGEWQARVRSALDCERLHVSVEYRGSRVNWEQMLHAWRTQPGARACVLDVLRLAPHMGYFCEMPPVSNRSASQAFEFVLMPTEALHLAVVDASAFGAYFQPKVAAVTFANLGGDARLVVPCPQPDTDLAAYSHLAAFVRRAPVSQQHALLVEVAQQVERKVSDAPLWVSTSGLGIAWLHVRLDSRPKYYLYAPFKTPPGGG